MMFFFTDELVLTLNEVTIVSQHKCTLDIPNSSQNTCTAVTLKQHTCTSATLKQHVHFSYIKATHVHFNYIKATHVHFSYIKATHVHFSYIKATHMHCSYTKATHVHRSYTKATHVHFSYIKATHVHFSYIKATHVHVTYFLVIYNSPQTLENVLQILGIDVDDSTSNEPLSACTSKQWSELQVGCSFSYFILIYIFLIMHIVQFVHCTSLYTHLIELHMFYV